MKISQWYANGFSPIDPEKAAQAEPGQPHWRLALFIGAGVAVGARYVPAESGKLKPKPENRI